MFINRLEDMGQKKTKSDVRLLTSFERFTLKSKGLDRRRMDSIWDKTLSKKFDSLLTYRSHYPPSGSWFLS